MARDRISTPVAPNVSSADSNDNSPIALAKQQALGRVLNNIEKHFLCFGHIIAATHCGN